jgi:putative transcriptional regulator
MQLMNLSRKLLVSNDRNNLINPPVVLILSQGADCTLGLVLNQPIGLIPFSEIFKTINASTGLVEYSNNVELLSGGFWNRNKVFVLHSNDYDKDVAMRVNDHIFLSSHHNTLREIARGKGPSKKLIAVGVSKWSPEEFEKDLWNHNWVICNPDPDLIFSEDSQGKWQRILSLSGMHPASYMQASGHC